MKHTEEVQSQEIEEAAGEMREETVRFAVIIPAYRPEMRLLDIIGALSEKSIPAIVLVDDGSGPEFAEIFRRAAEMPKVRLVRHAVNLGKGAALKTGINHAMCAFPDLQGVITADADGQHHPEDIEQIAEALAAQPDRVVLGARTFDSNVPARSRFGNVITRTVMHALVGQKVSDTQTGLRGIPAALLPHLLRMEANGYDFELDMLIGARRHAVPIVEVPIRTIYEPGNRTSHFNPLIDSMKIYFVLLRFSSVSLLTAALDSLVFYMAYRRLGSVAASQIVGRLLAVAFNYSMVRRTVFFSRQRHALVLPKYLLLVCVSGAASYAGIELLYSTLHIQPLPAKLLVETLLFFANFAIQRDFIFGKREAEQGEQIARPASLHAVILGAAAIVLLVVEWHGFRSGHLFKQEIWSQVGWQRFIHYAWVFGAVASAILLIAPGAFAAIAVGLIVLATIFAVGPLPVLAVTGFLIASCALGAKLLGRGDDTTAESQICATLLGVGVYVFLMTFLARLPVNYPAVYLLLLAIPVALDWRGVARRGASWGKAFAATRFYPPRQMAAFAVLVFVMAMHWLVVLQPEIGADGLAVHLAVPANLAAHHIFTYQPSQFIWTVMPLGADWCYSMVYLLGGEFAARLLNFGMLLMVSALLYRAARRWVSPAIAFIIIALFASTPLVQLVTGGLMVENFLAAVVFGMIAAIWRFGETGEKRFLYAAAVLGGTAMAIKLGGLAYVTAALPFAAIEIRRHWKCLGSRPALACGVAILLLLGVALPAYAIAYRMTGNPVFPFLNGKFPSPLLDRSADFKDWRFLQPLSFRAPYDLTFRTNRYYEGQAGSLGFHYLLLVPLGLIALFIVKLRPAVSAAVVSLAGALFVLISLPNARYLYASLPLLLVPVAALLGWLTPGPLRRGLIALALVCVALNAYFLPSNSYYHKDFYERVPLSAKTRQEEIHKAAPMREIAEYMNREHPGSAVFLASGSDIAGFNGEVYMNSWLEYPVWNRLRHVVTPQEIVRLLEQWKVRYVAAWKPGSMPPEAVVMADFLARCTTLEYDAGSAYLARLEISCKVPPLEGVKGVVYDDFDPSVAFKGPWIRDPGWPEAFLHTVTYCNIPGAEVRFAFSGNTLTYIYTRATNRGKAEVTIDGAHKTVVDLYAAQVAWQSRFVFQKLGPGRHLALIRVLPQKNQNSSDRYVDVDGFVVE
ncbi:MAG: glycosyltransferase [Bryobacteraceae bacterium]